MEDATTPNNMDLGFADSTISSGEVEMRADITNLVFPDNSISGDHDSRQYSEPLAIGWGSVPRNQWLRIVGMKNITKKCKDRKTKIVTLMTAAGFEFRAWMSGVPCAKLEAAVKDRTQLAGESTSQNLYVKSYGLKPSVSNPSRSYFDAEFIYW